MDDAQSLCHTKWDCKYHVVWIPKYRRKALYGGLRKHLGELLHDLARQKESKILEGHLQPDHVHVLVSIPPKFSVSQVIGFIKGKSAIQIARTYLGSECTFGRVGTLFQLLAPMKKQSENTSNCKRKKTSVSTN
jgi:putative transposase